MSRMVTPIVIGGLQPEARTGARKEGRMHWLLAVLAVVIVPVAPALAQAPPSAKALMQQMKDAYETARPSTRTITITVSDLGDSVKFVGYQASKRRADGNWLAMVMVAPPSIRGTAFLFHEPKDKTKPADAWTYAPTINRVRKLAPIEAYDHFLDTDFTFADLGLVRVREGDRLLGEEERDGVKVYGIQEEIPAEQMYYGRIVTWIAAGNHLPVERQYYDGANALWKKERFDTVKDIDGVPTVLHLQMKDVQAVTTTDMRLSDVRYDVSLPDSVFDPEQLGKLADNPVWKTPAGGK
jgi:hypothetical protein